MSNNKEIKKQNGNIDDEFIKEFDKLMEKYNMTAFYFYGEELDGWYQRLEFSNLDMMKLISRILFEEEGFEATRDVIISDILRFIDPFRIGKEKNDEGEWVDVPFIPSVYLQED